MSPRQKQNRIKGAGGEQRSSFRFSLGSSGISELWDKWRPYVTTGLVLMLLPVVCLQTYRYFLASDHFSVQSVTLEGLELLEEDEVLQFAGIAEGQRLLDLNENTLRLNLERHPRVRKASVQVDLPNRVTIHIEERGAAAVVVLRNLFLADAQGELFKPVEKGDDIEGLPLMTGLVNEEVEGSDKPTVTHSVVRDGIDLSVVYAAHPVSLLKPLGELHHDPLFGWSVMTSDDGMEIRLGMGQFEEKLDRLQHILRDLNARGAKAEIVRLDSSRDPARVAVRMHYVDTEPDSKVEFVPPTPTVTKVKRTRKPPSIPNKGISKAPLKALNWEKSSELDEILGN